MILPGAGVLHRRRALRRLLGSAVRRLEREAQWRLRPSLFRISRSSAALPFEIAVHTSPLFRNLPGVDHGLQVNKVVNLRLAAERLDGIVLAPGRRLSFWHEVGPPTYRRGFLDGLVLACGRIGTGVGGGLCQMTNLLYWMTLHTPLSVLERWRHGYDVFPDVDRKQPFGSGATCAWPSLDLQIGNPTPHPFRLSIRVTGETLEGRWTSTEPGRMDYWIEEREHSISFEYPGVYVRRNELWRMERNTATSEVFESLVAKNSALMTYQPLVCAPGSG